MRGDLGCESDGPVGEREPGGRYDFGEREVDRPPLADDPPERVPEVPAVAPERRDDKSDALEPAQACLAHIVASFADRAEDEVAESVRGWVSHAGARVHVHGEAFVSKRLLEQSTGGPVGALRRRKRYRGEAVLRNATLLAMKPFPSRTGPSSVRNAKNQKSATALA